MRREMKQKEIEIPNTKLRANIEDGVALEKENAVANSSATRVHFQSKIARMLE